MKLPVAILAMIASLSISHSTPQASVAATPEQEVRAVIHEVNVAMKDHDRVRLDQLLAADFVMLHSTGNVEPRQSFLDRAAAGALMSQRVPAEVLEDTLRIYDGRTALRTTKIKAVLHPAEKPVVEIIMRSIDVYVKVGSRWLWVSEQSTPIPPQQTQKP